MEENEEKPSQVQDSALNKRIGFLKGKIKIPDNFEEIDREMDREIEDLFYGGELFPPERSSSDESDADRSGSGPKGQAQT